MTKDDLRRKEVRKMAEEIAFPGEKWAPLNLGVRAWKGPELAKAIEAFGIACMKAGMEEAAEIADNYDCSSRFDVITPTGKAANHAAKDIRYDIRQKAKSLTGEK